MRFAQWFQIECVDGSAATLYVTGRLDGELADELRASFAQLPAALQTLRVHLGGAGSREPVTVRIVGQAIRQWRLARAPVRVIVSPILHDGLPGDDLMLEAHGTVAPGPTVRSSDDGPPSPALMGAYL